MSALEKDMREVVTSARASGVGRFGALRLESAFAVASAISFEQVEVARAAGDDAHARLMQHAHRESALRARAYRFFLQGVPSEEWV